MYIGLWGMFGLGAVAGVVAFVTIGVICSWRKK